MMTIGERIAEIRKNSHMSQEAFGESLGVTRQAISKWESDVSIPDVDKLILISKTYNVPVGWILGVEDKHTNEEFTEAQLELVREIVRQCTKEIENRLNEGEPYIPVETAPPPKKKGRKFMIFLAIAAIIIFAVWCSNMSEQLLSLKNSQNYLQSQITSVESSVYNQTNVLTGQIEEILNAQNSVLADFGYSIIGYDYAADTADIEVYMIPKTYTDGMTAEFTAVSDDKTFTATGTEGEGHRFKGVITCKLSNCITLTVSITNGEIVETQLIDIIYHAKEQTMPTVYFSSSTTWGTTYNSEQFSHEEHIFISEDKYSEAYFKGIHITDVTVYLIINDKVTDEFVCTTSDDNRDFTDWSVSFPFDYDIKNGDTLQYAAVATDNYGRQHLIYDMGYIVEDNFIDYDVSYKFDNTEEDIYGLLD